MVNEIELKFFNLDIKALQEKIISLGGFLDYAGDMRAVYFDNGELKKQKGALRLRQQPVAGGLIKTILTRKEHISESGVKSCRETETTVGNFNACQNILLSLGYKPVLTIVKHRSSYILNGGRIEIDTHKEDLSYIPPFVELEASDKTKLWDLALNLDLDPNSGLALNAFEIQNKFKKH